MVWAELVIKSITFPHQRVWAYYAWQCTLFKIGKYMHILCIQHANHIHEVTYMLICDQIVLSVCLLL